MNDVLDLSIRALLHETAPRQGSPEEQARRAGTPGGTAANDPRELLKPCPLDMLECFPVSMKVNSPKNDAPDLIDPAR